MYKCSPNAVQASKQERERERARGAPLVHSPNEREERESESERARRGGLRLIGRLVSVQKPVPESLSQVSDSDLLPFPVRGNEREGLTSQLC